MSRQSSLHFPTTPIVPYGCLHNLPRLFTTTIATTDTTHTTHTQRETDMQIERQTESHTDARIQKEDL